MTKQRCSFIAQGKTCVLDIWHDNVHQDETGFKFIDDDYPNFLGNGPSGYPMNNKAFDRAAKKYLEDCKEDAEKAERFLEELARATRSK